MAFTEQINAALDSGKTVIVGTAWKVLTVKTRHLTAWRNAGFEFFRNGPCGVTMVISGQSGGRPHYVCIDWFKIVEA